MMELACISIIQLSGYESNSQHQIQSLYFMLIAFIGICISSQVVLLRYGLRDRKNVKIRQTQLCYQTTNNIPINE